MLDSWAALQYLALTVKEGKGKKNGKKLQEMMDFLHVENTLAKEIGIQM